MSSRDDDAPKLTFKPVTEANREDFLAVFGKGGPSYCWCMPFRVTPEEKKAAPRGSDRRQLMLGRIADKVPVGLVGYLSGEPVAWVSVAPRDTFNNALGSPDPRDGEKVWALTCLFIRRTHRGQGLGHQLIAAAVSEARKRKATVLEAYPVDPDSPSYRHMGFVPAFAAAGFRMGDKIGTRRHLMTLTISAHSAGEC
jgi:GNAT superfamily N-acetyltransferase